MKKSSKIIWIALSVILWIGLWTVLAYRLNKPVLLPYPKNVFKALITMVTGKGFLPIVRGSFVHVAAGFLCALLAGILLAVIGSLHEVIDILLMPGVKLIKTVPVVSFIILLLFFVKPAGIGFVISWLMVFPVVYENVRKGIVSADRKLLETAQVFRFPFLRKLAYILIPSAVPYTAAACSAGLGLCWKAGIAAELIAQSPESIGHELYYSKLYVDAESVFAWTIVIILVSVLFEKFFMIVFRLLTVAVSAPTLLKHKGDLLRYLFGIRGKSKAVAESAEEPTEEPVEETAGEAEAEPVEGATATNRTEAAQMSAETAAESNETVTEPPVAAPVLTLSGIGKSFDSKPVLSGVDLSLIPGTVTVVSGPSGCGKTTLLRILLGLETADEGTREAENGLTLSAVFQENRLMEQLSASKNVRIASAAESKKEASGILKEAGIEETEGKPVSAFSGGMKRRVAWCRALLAPSKVLVLDEPFTGLDEAKKDRMIYLLAKHKKDNAIVIVTHNPSEITKIRSAFSDVRTLTFDAKKKQF